ncbi:MAG: DeoR family transcriptional regulator [Nitrospirota bacterium]
MKTNKHLTLLLMNKNEGVRSQDIVKQFDYSPGTARSYLSYLGRQGLLERTPRGYILTIKGKDRLQFFEVTGCGNPDCPLCESKKAKYFTCPMCEYQLSKSKARISPEWDFLLGVRHAGVYCPLCQKLLFTEAHAQLIGIPKEVKR